MTRNRYNWHDDCVYLPVNISIHELGHCFGLVHCHDPACVMRTSTYVEDIDMKPVDFCQECTRLEVITTCRTFP